jgi:hypothetical protein
MDGIKKKTLLSEEIIKNTNDEFYKKLFKPIFDDIHTDAIGFQHIKMIKEIFIFWKLEKP